MEQAANKQPIREEVQRAIRLLIERFWITKDDDEELYYLIRDHELEMKAFFRDTFRYRLMITHELVKLEKIPVKTYNWMGNKNVKGQTTFKRQRDFVFLFCILAFTEGKGRDDQFSLQNICEAIQAYYPQADALQPVTIIWKEGAGYDNRLSLIRVLKYMMKMKLIVEVDQYLEDFAANSEHDVLFERTPYASYFIRNFKDLFSWRDYEDFQEYLANENEAYIAGKHRFYRRLFLEPIVYHDEITEEEKEYVKRYYHLIENNIEKYTGYEFERYQHNDLLRKTIVSTGEVIHPADNMRSNLVLRFAGFLLQHQADYSFSFSNQLELSNHDIQTILTHLKENDSRFWSKSFKQMSSEQLSNVLTTYLRDWNFAERKDEQTWTIKEGLFRIVGDYHQKDKEAGQ